MIPNLPQTTSELRMTGASDVATLNRKPDGKTFSATRRQKFVIASVLILIAVVAVNHQQVTALRDRFVPKRWGLVVEGKIYRTGQLSRHLVKQVLQDNHIQTVVDLTFANAENPNHTAD